MIFYMNVKLNNIILFAFIFQQIIIYTSRDLTFGDFHGVIPTQLAQPSSMRGRSTGRLRAALRATASVNSMKPVRQHR